MGVSVSAVGVARSTDVGTGALGSIDGGDEEEGVSGIVGAFSGVGGVKRAEGEREARVGSEASSGWGASVRTAKYQLGAA